MLHKIVSLLISISFVCFSLGCSSDSSGDATLAGSSIASLPANTDPVAATTSQGLAKQAIDALAAVTGLKLSEWANTANWQAGNSRAMCEVGQALKEALSEAMNPDKIKCYVGAVHSSGGLGNVTIDDGSDVFFRLVNFPENPNMQPRIKLKITKDATGRINRFEMWSCFEFDGTNYSQSEYILQTIGTDRSVSSYSKHAGSSGSETYGGISNITGVLNDSFQWTSKSMSLQRSWTDGSASNSQDVAVTQKSGSFVVNGYNAGSWGQDIFSNAFYAEVQGLNLSNPKDIALGDGSASYNLDWCFDSNSNSSCADEGGGNRHQSVNIDSWNGDTRANLGTASDGDYHSAVASATVPTVSTVAAVNFTGDEVWDCSASSFLDADMTNMDDPSTQLGAAFQTCDGKYDYQDNGTGYACDAAQQALRFAQNDKARLWTT